MGGKQTMVSGIAKRIEIHICSDWWDLGAMHIDIVSSTAIRIRKGCSVKGNHVPQVTRNQDGISVLRWLPLIDSWYL